MVWWWIGFATAFLLAEASVLVKEYANFFDMLLTVFLNWMLFSAPVKSTLLTAIVMVSVSLYLYNVPAVDPSAAADPAGGGVPLTSIAVSQPAGGGGGANSTANAEAGTVSVPLLGTPNLNKP